MRWGQAFADIHPEKCIFSQGNVEFEKLGLAEMKQGSPEHAWWHLLGHAPAYLQISCIYAAVSKHTRP